MLSDRSGTQGVIVVTALYTFDEVYARILEPVCAFSCWPESDPQRLCIQANPLLAVENEEAEHQSDAFLSQNIVLLYNHLSGRGNHISCPPSKSEMT